MKNQYYKLRVLREGLITTIQDNGFIKLQHLGITTGGAIDDFSYKLGNIILSNKSNTPSIEFAKLGPKFLVEHGSLNIAITGNVNFLLKLKGRNVQGSTNRSYFLDEGDEIDVQSTQNSNYGYIAIKKGFLTSSFENSSSTLISSQIGGNNGKKISANQLITGISSLKSLNYKFKEIDYEPTRFIRVIKGPQMHFFKIKDIKKFFKKEFEISDHINRTGIRLINNIVKPLKSYNIDSEGIIRGSIQIPGDGNPIVLACDHPTIGGYPKIATVIMADFGKLVQLPSHTKFFFKEITILEAERLLIDYQNRLNNIKKLLIKI